MVIWSIDYWIGGYYTFLPVDKADWHQVVKQFRQRLGAKVGDKWQPRHGTLYKKKDRRLGNFLHSSNGPILDQKAAQLFQAKVAESIELLPLKTDHRDFYLLHVLDIVDCIDYERSEIAYYESTGRLAGIVKYVFKKELIEGKPIFMLPEDGMPNIYISDEFKKAIEDNGLEGVKFIKRWEDEAAIEPLEKMARQPDQLNPHDKVAQMIKDGTIWKTQIPKP